MNLSGVVTTDDLLGQALGLGLGGGPLGTFLGGLIKTPLYQTMGLQDATHRDALLDYVLMSDKTPFGTAMELQNRRLTRVASANVQRASDSALRSWLSDFGRTLMSPASFAAQGGKPEEYEAHIQDQAAKWASNPIWAGIYKFVDPDGINAASQYLEDAGANMIRRGYLSGRRGAALQAQAINQLFRGENGQFNFQPRTAKYGWMDIGEVSAVAAALTKDLDFFDQGPVNSDSIKKAASDLDQKLQAYTKALAPLKDVFGKDIPAMIKAVEELSGKKLSQIEAGSLERMVKRTLDNATAGNYTLQQQVDSANAWRGALLQMNVPFLNDLSAIAVTGSILSATNVAGVAPQTMSNERWAKRVSNKLTRASLSKGGEAFAQAFAIMKARNNSLTWEEFMADYDRSFNGSIDQTLYNMTGTRNAADLARRGAESGYLADAYELGVNKLASVEMGARRARTRLYDKLISQGYKGSDIQAVLNYFDSTEKLAGTRIAAGSGLSAGAIAIGNNLLVTDAYADEMDSLRALYSERESAARAAIVAKNRQVSEAIRGAPGSVGELIRDVMGGKTLDDFTEENKKLFLIASGSDAWNLGKTAYKIAKAQTTKLRGSQYAEATAMKAADYAMREGATDEYYLEWAQKFDSAKTDQERDQAADILMALQYGNSGEIGEYLRSGGDPETITKKLRQFVSKGRTGEFATEMSDELKVNKLIKTLDATKGIQNKADIVAKLTDYQNAEGAIETSGLQKILTENGITAEQAGDLIQASDLKSGSSLEAILTDKFNILDNLAKALETLVQKLGGMDGTSPADKRSEKNSVDWYDFFEAGGK